MEESERNCASDVSREASGVSEHMLHDVVSGVTRVEEPNDPARGGRGRVGARSADKVRGSAVRSADEVRAQRERGKKRQSVRRLALLVSFLLFPVIIFYFSPALIIEGALEGAVAASMLVFCLQFLSAIVLRRAWCGWLCPAGGLQELEATAVGKPAKLGWRARVKYVIWVPWVCSIVACAWIAGGFTTVDPLYGIPGGVSMNSPLGLPICWMAPFMVLGEKLGSALRVPQLRIEADPNGCIGCGKCDRACPMSLPVQDLLAGGAVADAECIQCAACADVCPKGVLRLRMGRMR